MTKKVLFVDDDTNILASFRRRLGRRFDITTVPGGEQGLEALDTLRPERPPGLCNWRHSWPRRLIGSASSANPRGCRKRARRGQKTIIYLGDYVDRGLDTMACGQETRPWSRGERGMV